MGLMRPCDVSEHEMSSGLCEANKKLFDESRSVALSACDSRGPYSRNELVKVCEKKHADSMLGEEDDLAVMDKTICGSRICFSGQSVNGQNLLEDDIVAQYRDEWTREEQSLSEAIESFDEMKKYVRSLDVANSAEVRLSGTKADGAAATGVVQSSGAAELWPGTGRNLDLEKILEREMLENIGVRTLAVGNEFNDDQTTKCSSGRFKRMRVWRGEESSGDTHHNSQDIPGERCTGVRCEHSASSRTSGDHEQDYLRNHTRIEAQHRANQQEASRQGKEVGGETDPDGDGGGKTT